MGLLWSLIVGALIGAIAGAITNRGKAMGCIANIFAGLVGSWAGQALFGSWGPSLAGMAPSSVYSGSSNCGSCYFLLFW